MAFRSPKPGMSSTLRCGQLTQPCRTLGSLQSKSGGKMSKSPESEQTWHAGIVRLMHIWRAGKVERTSGREVGPPEVQGPNGPARLI